MLTVFQQKLYSIFLITSLPPLKEKDTTLWERRMVYDYTYHYCQFFHFSKISISWSSSSEATTGDGFSFDNFGSFSSSENEHKICPHLLYIPETIRSCIQVKNINTGGTSKYLPEPTWTKCPVLFTINWEKFLFIPRSALAHFPRRFYALKFLEGHYTSRFPLSNRLQGMNDVMDKSSWYWHFVAL